MLRSPPSGSWLYDALARELTLLGAVILGTGVLAISDNAGTVSKHCGMHITRSINNRASAKGGARVVGSGALG